MFKELFPTHYERCLSLSVLGSSIDGLIEFFTKQGCSPTTIFNYMYAIKIIDYRLQKLKCSSINKISRSILQACVSMSNRNQKNFLMAVKLLERYFEEQGILPPQAPKPLSPIEVKLTEYFHYLQKESNIRQKTAEFYRLTASKFLDYINKAGDLSYLSRLTPQNIEDFIRDVGNKVKRRTLNNVITALRSFLRFLSVRGEISIRLDNQIDTPRVYREEQLPRALDWKIVCALLQTIDRSTAIGKRDYAMLLLIATYGLRAGEVVRLKLEDIEWRANRLQILQNKTFKTLLLPLTDLVGQSIIEYLREGRPSVSNREIFVKHKAPNDAITSLVVANVFNTWVRRSGLSIPFQGPHCLRHSYAVHLLRQSTPIKTIGDILGHSSFKSTSVYLRLNIEDLRTVPLCIPTSSSTIEGTTL